MSTRKKQPTMIEKLRGLINEARLVVAAPNSVPVVAHKLLTRPYLRKLSGIRGLRVHLFAEALNAEIRRYFKADTDEGDGVSPDQLEMWPAQLHVLIKEIDRARVFVPSRGEFVLLAPDVITASEAKAAGDYLIMKGRDCIFRGNKLITLSERM